MKHDLTLVRVLSGVGILLLLLEGCSFPSSSSLRDYAQTQKITETVPEGLHARFFGATTILVSDGTTSIMVDGYFSRPEFIEDLVLRGTGPNERRINAALEKGGVCQADRKCKLDALLVAHSHFDHGMDAPTVAKKTGALLVGSQSTLNIADLKSAEFESLKSCRIRTGAALKIGEFTIRFFESPHARAQYDFLEFPGKIVEPVRPPARVWDYRSDVNYTFLLQHRRGTVLIVPSTNLPLGISDAERADVVFLSIGHLSLRLDERDFVDNYWHKAVRVTGATLVFPVHWDSLAGKLKESEPLELPPSVVDNVPAAMQALRERAGPDGQGPVRLALMPLFGMVALEIRDPKPVERVTVPVLSAKEYCNSSV